VRYLPVLALAVVLFAPADAFAASLERLVMPGPVITGHADLENECSNCHKAFVAGEQTALCLDCHEEIAGDVSAQKGMHGFLAKDQPELVCKNCHTEHKGRDADIVGLNRNAFDHDRTDFSLVGAHKGRDCASCHEADEPFRDAPATCVACHGDEQPHQKRLGEDCAQCHSEERSWPDIRFDHAKTDFPLRGAHEDVVCSSCHVDEVWDGLPKTCVSCHSADDVHKGGRGTNCATCHNSTKWSDAVFDHLKETGFALAGRHEELVCSACHLDGMAIKKPPERCIGCHSAEDEHRGRFGTDCAECHGVKTWENEYDHEAETGFALQGAHEPLACESCHKGALTDELATTCIGCHEDDDPHNGRYRACDGCHTVVSWHSVAFDHGFTAFPLIGIHSSAACEACHTDLEFTGVSQVCGDCHAERDYHKGAFGQQCSTCHNPNGWDRWQFDHDEQTTYPLTGGHQGLECGACHNSAMTDEIELSRACISCHAADDAHDGRFGTDCGRCHTTESFTDTALLGR
jgi:Cytochrome c7 and related cytochrome c/Cytochrome c3